MKITEKMKRFFTLNAARSEGFTLVELIVVIAILAILAGVAIPAYSGYIEKSKRAGDETLLAAVNDAFASACVMNGSDIWLETSASVTMKDGKVTGLASPAAYANDFATFFEGNTNAKFEVFAGLYFDRTLHQFKELSSEFANVMNNLVGYETQIGDFQASGLGQMGTDKLLTTVDGVTGLAAEMIGAGAGKVYDMIFDEEGVYITNLANKLGKDPEGLFNEILAMDESTRNQFLANSTVLSVAGTVNSNTYDKDRINDMLATGSIGTIVSEINTSENGLADAAVVFGMYTAYTKGEGEAVNSLADLNKIGSDAGFQAYLQTLSSPDSQASKDLQGYYAALDVVNGAVSNDPAVANKVLTEGYDSDELAGVLGNILG